MPSFNDVHLWGLIKVILNFYEGLPGGGSVVKVPPASAGDCTGFYPWVEKIPWRRRWQLVPVFLPGKLHGQRNLTSYSPWGHKESDTTEWLNNFYGGVCIYPARAPIIKYHTQT